MNSYYNHGSFPATGSAATSASMRAELQLVTTGFDKLPDLSGNQNKIIVVNSTGTGLTSTDVLPASNVIDSDFTFQDNADATRKFRFEASSVTAGQTRVLTVPDANATLVGTDTTQTLTAKTLTTPVLFGTASGTTAGRLGYSSGVFTYGDGSAQRTVVNTDEAQTLTNKTLSTGTVISAGTINNAAIGGTTPAAGAFTTLSASSTVSGTGFSTYLASPPAIGGTAAAAGSFTTLSASSNVTLSGGTANGVLYLNGSKVATSGSALTFDGTNFATTGTVSGTKLIPTGGAVTGNGMYLPAANAVSITTNGADRVYIDSSGNVGIGTSSPSAFGAGYTTLEVKGTSGTLGGYIIATANGGATQMQLAGDSGVGYVGTRTNHPVYFLINNTEKMRLDSSGNLGLGVTPSAWFSGGNTKVIQISDSSSLIGTADSIRVEQNAYYNSGGSAIYLTTGAASEYLQSSGQHTWKTAPSGTAGNAITFTQAMTLDASGNLLVGTTSNPLATRAVISHSGAGYALTVGDIDTYTNRTGIYLRGGNENRIGWDNAGYLTFVAGTTERARITSDGKFVVGDTTATNALLGARNASNTPLLAAFSTASSGYTDALILSEFRNYSPNNTTARFLYCGDSVDQRCVIYSSGTISNSTGTYNTISDEKLKQDIVDASSQWDDIKALRIVKYRLKNEVAIDPNYPAYIGVIAQEVEQVSPGLVDNCPDFENIEVTDDEGNVTTERRATGTVTKAVKSSIIYMKAVKALQEAMTRIETLEAQNAAFEARLAALESK